MLKLYNFQLSKSRECFSIYAPQLGNAEAKINVPSCENSELLKVLTFQFLHGVGSRDSLLSECWDSLLVDS